MTDKVPDKELDKKTDNGLDKEPVKELDKEPGSKETERDALDGGFAVVDRERLIEEETREVTPWYKLFIMAFTSPGQMMEECFDSEPTKGGSVGAVGCILFTVINMLLVFFNPVTKIATMEQLRAGGITEESLEQVYSISMISGIVIGIITVFVSCLLTAILIQIIKAVLRDKGSFTNLYKMLLIASMVGLFVNCIDGAITYFLGMSEGIFTASIFLSDAMKSTALWSTLGSFISISNLVTFIIMIIGYKIVTHTSYARGAIVVIITQLISFAASYAYVDFALKMQASVLGA